MSPQQLECWMERMQHALALLTERLDDPPSLQELADAACCSPFHFHRIWRALVGEPVNRTVSRLRIAAAQQRLRVPGATVTGVAMDGGFGTPQSFARAFRRVAGVSPSEFLASGHAEIGIAHQSEAGVRVELRPSCTLVALRRTGGAYEKLNALFARVWSWADESGKLGDLEGIYGLPIDDPLSSPIEELRYDACLALGENAHPPEPFRRIALPAGEYAGIRKIGSYDDLEETDQSLIRWVVASDRTPADFPLVHHFHDDPDETPVEKLRTDILLLLEPKESSR